VAANRTIAVVDVGSNSVRLLVARELSPVAFEVVDEERFDARLGEGQAGGDLTSEGMERGLRAMRIMSEVARSFAPNELEVVGTEALRRAPNAGEFIQRVREESGVTVRVLSGQEEAFAGFLGVVNSTQLRDGHLLDIGGGSLELMRVEGRRLAEVQSAPLGAIYATERYLKGDPPTAREIRALRKAVRQQIEVRRSTAALYGTGGAVRNLARIVRMKRRYPLRRLHGIVLARGEVRRLANQLAGASLEERRRLPGVGSNRADILHAAAIVVDEVMELTGATTLTVAGQGLREGVLWQRIRGEAAVLPEVRAASISGLARANGIDELAAEPVVTTAARLFEGTAELHGLGRDDRDLLLAGARLAGIGMHVDYYNRDRHAEYLVHSGDLHGFSHREIVMLGALVRWASAGTPVLSPYKAVVEADDTRKAMVLASLLGTAQAIRRRSPSPVHEIETDIKDGACRITLTGGDALDAEMYELERQQKRLETALKVSVTFRARSQASRL
jgi:exopolyphosphatase/guanosine-5'-triphosphate,3'-diphosphate pyrophosphatase